MESLSDDLEQSIRALANLIAQCNGIASRLDDFRRLYPPPADAPFLHRQLEQALRYLQRSIDGRLLTERKPAHKELEAKGEEGMLLRIKRSFFRQREGEEEQETVSKADLFAKVQREGLQGNSWTIPIPELIGFLATGRKSGVLWVHDPHETFLLELRNGRLAHATSDRTPVGERLGEVLIDQGTLTERTLQDFLQHYTKSQGMLGDALKDAGLITARDLERALAAQVQHLFLRLLRAKNAIFRFEEGMQLLIAQHVELNITQLLLESARAHDESDSLERQARETLQNGGRAHDDVHELPDDASLAASGAGASDQAADSAQDAAGVLEEKASRPD